MSKRFRKPKPAPASSVPESPPATTHHITLYSGVNGGIADAAEMTWDEIVSGVIDLLQAEPFATDKRQLFAIGPHRLRDPKDGRVLVNVDAITLLAIDVDRADLASLQREIESQEATCMVYTSPSDPNPDGSRRVRILAPLTEEYAPILSADMRYAFATWLDIPPGVGVEGAHDAAHIFFVGRLIDSPPREYWVYERGQLAQHS